MTQTKDPGGAPRFLRTLGPDEVFGEIGLLARRADGHGDCRE